jgi:hypothetical protein
MSARAAAAPPALDLQLADDPDRWRALGFGVADGCCQLGSVCLRLHGRDAGRGLLGLSLRGLRSAELDGLSASPSSAPPPEPAAEHPNGVMDIDHVVAMSPALDRTVAALQAAGLDLRRIREEPTPAGAPRQAFFRLGEAILEVIQMPAAAVERAGGEDMPARLWGLALNANLDRALAAMAPHVGDAHAALQEGRRIATLQRSAGLAIPVALMSPAPKR